MKHATSSFCVSGRNRGLIRYILCLIAITLSTVDNFGQTNYVTWNFTTSISNANYATNFTNQVAARSSSLTSPTLSNILITGSGISGTSANTFHRTTGWPTTQDNAKYLEFSVQLGTGQTYQNTSMNLAIAAGVNSTTTAARNYQVLYGWGISPTFANATNGNVTNLGTSQSSNTATIPAPGNTTTTLLTVRITAYGSTSSTGNIQFGSIALSLPAPSTYTITYNSNSATSGTVPTDATTYSPSSSVIVKTNSGTLARTGYTFTGWNTTADGSGTSYAADGSTTLTINSNTTLYAKWTANNNIITFDGNGNTGGSMSTQTIATAASANLNSNLFEKMGYTFAGWATSAGGVVAYANGANYTMGTVNVTLYAKWTPNNNTVTFDGNGSTGGSMSGQTIATDASANLTSNTFTRTGYSFNGWNTAADGSGTSYANGASYAMGTGNVTLYAIWSEVTTPTITVSGTIQALSTTYGTASSAASFNVSGSALSSDILITPPAGFEVSQTSGGASGYTSTQTLTRTGGNVALTTIYVRLAATTLANTYSGNVVISNGEVTQNNAIPSSTVSPYTLTVSGLSGVNKVYDGTTTASLTGTEALSSTVNSDVITLTGTAVGTYTSATVANNKTINISGLSISGPNVGSYSLTAPTTTANITAAPLTITGISISDKVYNGNTAATITGTAAYSGLVNGETFTVTGSPTAIFADANVNTNISVTVSGYTAPNSNYSITQPTGFTASITKADQTITGLATTDSKTTATAPYTISGVTASSGLSVTYASSNTSVATISGTTVTIVGTGTTTITATQAGNGNYNAAPSVEQMLTVTQATNASDYFRSKANGNWNSNTTWESSSDNTNWISATAAPTSTANTITISTGHTVSVTAAVTIDQVNVNSGGQITVNSGQTLTIANGTGTDLTIGGTLLNSGSVILQGTTSTIIDGTFTNSGSLTLNTATTSITVNGIFSQTVSTAITNSSNGPISFAAGSEYRHQTNGGTIPTSTWNLTSTCNVTGMAGTSPGGLGQVFGKFIWNCSSQSTYAVIGASGSLNPKGLFTLSSSGNSVIELESAGSGSTYIFDGGLKITGGTFVVNYDGSGTSKEAALNINGNLEISGNGILDIAQGNASATTSTYLGTIYLTGDITISSSISYPLTATSNNNFGRLIFNGNSVQNYYRTSSLASQYVDFEIPTSKSLLLQNSLQLFSSSSTVYDMITINGTINTNTNSVIQSAGTASRFILNSGATFITANATGVTGAITVGGTKTFSSAANYEFQGASTGAFTTSPTAATVNNLSINNASGVTLGQNITVNGALNLTSGKLVTASNTLTLGASATVTNASSSSYVNGNLKKIITAGTTTKTFEIGDATAYAPVTLDFDGTVSNSTGTIQASTAVGDHAQIASSGLIASKTVNRTWTLTNAVALTGMTSYSPTFSYVVSDVDASATTSNFVVKNYSSSAWNALTTGSKTSTSSQATGVTTFGDFAIGEMKSNPTISVSNTPTYNGTAIAAIVTGSVAGTVSNVKYNGSATVPTNAGDYTITADFIPTDAANYSNLTGASAGTFTISKAPQSITFGTLSAKYVGDADYSPGATSATSGTNAITYTSSNTAVATIVSNQIHIVGAGTTTITASQGASANYNAASDVSQDLTVATRPIISITSTENSSILTDANANINIANGAELTIDANKTVNNVTVAPGGKLTLIDTYTLNSAAINLQSDYTGTATFVDKRSNVNPSPINATVEQYLPQGRNWYISAPVAGAYASSIGGTGLGTSVAYYNEPGSAWVENYIGTLFPGVGYIAVSSAGTGTNNAVFSGTLNSGNIVIPITRQGTTKAGFNLVANPYPSYLDGKAAISGSANLEPTIWYRTKIAGTYYFETVNTTSGVGSSPVNGSTVSRLIPPMQAFWVRTLTDNNTLTFTNAMRYHANPTISGSTVNTTSMKAPATNNTQLVRLLVSNGTTADETVIYTDNNAKNGYDNYDSQKMFNNSSTVPDIYSIIDGAKLVINGLNNWKNDLEIPLGFAPGKAGVFTLKATELSNIDPATELILRDKIENSDISLSGNQLYTFNSDGTTATDRFSVVFKTKSIATGTAAGNATARVAALNTKHETLTLVCPDTKVGKVGFQIFNALGQMLSNGTIISTRTNLHLPAGMYSVCVDGVSSKIIIK